MNTPKIYIPIDNNPSISPRLQMKQQQLPPFPTEVNYGICSSIAFELYETYHSHREFSVTKNYVDETNDDFIICIDNLYIYVRVGDMGADVIDVFFNKEDVYILTEDNEQYEISLDEKMLKQAIWAKFHK